MELSKKNMFKKFIVQIQNQLISFLKGLSDNGEVSLKYLVADSCSEISRLVGCWILAKYPKANVYVSKTFKKIPKIGSYHDLLIVEYKKEIYIIDPTIWQIESCKRNILIFVCDTIDNALVRLKKLYGESWEISEMISPSKCTVRQQNKLKLIIKDNMS